MNPTASRLLLVAALLLAVLAGAGGIRLASALQPAVVDAAPPVPAGTRPGDVLAATELRTVSADEARAILADAGFAPPSPARAVRLTRVAYASLDPSDAVVPATGLVAVPEPGTPTLVPAVHLHGSALNRGAVPSQAASPFLYGPALALASRGYAAVLPDYLGLGGAPGRHPYLQHRSAAQSAVDLLLAARTLLAEQGTALDDEVLVSGFSQGARPRSPWPASCPPTPRASAPSRSRPSRARTPSRTPSCLRCSPGTSTRGPAPSTSPTCSPPGTSPTSCTTPPPSCSGSRGPTMSRGCSTAATPSSRSCWACRAVPSAC